MLLQLVEDANYLNRQLIFGSMCIKYPKKKKKGSMWLQQTLIVWKSDKTNSTPNFTEEERTSYVSL